MVKDKMNIVRVRTQKELLGLPCIELELVAPKKQGISVAQSLGQMQNEYGVIEESVANFASSISVKLRKQKSCANIIHVFLHIASNSSYEIVKFALMGLKNIYRQGYHFKKAGVMVSGLVNETTVQTALFDKVDRDKADRVMKALDKTNRVYARIL